MGNRASWSYEITLGDQLVSASRARAFVRHHLAEHHLAHLSDDVELVVTEFATNVVLHAHTVFTVSLHAFEQTLVLAVADGSQDWPARAVAADVFDTHGRGLTIVDHVCRDWGTQPLPTGGKSVWAEFSVCA
jgi:anti-sigma regulatory factor (Ser/Thr protein kinase)